MSEPLMIDADGSIYRPATPYDARHYAERFGAVVIKGLMCRCLHCCCRDGEGHRSAEAK